MKSWPIILLSLAACGETPTELIVVVDTDLEAPAQLGAVRAVVGDMPGSAPRLNDFMLAGGDVPFSFVIVPSGTDLEKLVLVEVIAYSPSHEELFRRRAETQFLSSRRLKLPMYLAKRCVTEAAMCGAGSTCTESGCVSPMIAASSLMEVEPGREL